MLSTEPEKKLFCFHDPDSKKHRQQNNSLSASSPQNRIVSPAPEVTLRSHVTVPRKKSQHNSGYEVDPVKQLNHDTDYQENNEEGFQDDDDAPYLIEGDIALPKV